MSAKDDSTTGSKGQPSKRLELRREKLRDLKVQTGVRAGTMAIVGPVSPIGWVIKDGAAPTPLPPAPPIIIGGGAVIKGG